MQNSPNLRRWPVSLHEELSAQGPLACTWFALGSPALVEIALDACPDFIVIDRQHGLWERTSLEAAIGIARHQVPVVVRCAENTAQSIAEALDAGASSALIPLVESADEARRAVAFGRYPPQGRRSAGGIRPLMAGVETMRNDAGRIAIGVMIETVRGVEQVEAIAAVEGLDYLFIGTGDLALSRGNVQAGVLDADHERVLRAARGNGLPCGIFTGTTQDAQRQLARGFDFVVSASDIEVTRSGFQHTTAALRQ
jgi:2-keto-3-deoxy-L-rhamnonate aldolase RhmA